MTELKPHKNAPRDCQCNRCRAFRDAERRRRAKLSPAQYRIHADGMRLVRVDERGPYELLPDGSEKRFGERKPSVQAVARTVDGKVLPVKMTARPLTGSGFPGFAGTFQIGGLGDCCDETVSACFNFDPNGSTCSLGVDFCGCTGLPETLYADVTGAYVGTVTMTWDGTSKYSGTFTTDDPVCEFTIELTCLDAETRTFKTSIFSANEDCDDCNNEDMGVIATCSPFSLTTTVPISGAGGACPFWEIAGSWGVTYSE